MPFAIFFSVPTIAALPTVFLIRVVVPVLLGSIAVAIISVLILRRRAEPSATLGDAISLVRTGGMDVLTMSLVATLLAIVAVLFFGAYGFVVLAFFYGPPIAMQVLASERLPLRASLSTARSYLSGNWRLVLYLFTIALGSGLVAFVVLGAAFAGLREGPRPWSSIALALSQGLVTGALASVVAAAQVAAYLRVREGFPGNEPANANGSADATPG